MNVLTHLAAAAVLFAISFTARAEEPDLISVSTAFGLGADAQLNEHENRGTTAGSSGDLNTRTSSNGDRNEIVALRFDLGDYTLAQLSDVSLQLFNFRNNSARQVALYGVRQGAMGATGIFSTEDWDEGLLTAFGDMPGLLETDLDYTTQSLNPEQVTFLGQITFSSLEKGTIETFSDPALTAFIRGYTGSKLVTFLLAAAPGYTSTGQARVASKEAAALDGGDPAGAPGDFAPHLSFRADAGGVPPSVLITSPANGADLPLNTPVTIEVSATSDVAIARVEFFAGTEEPLNRLGEDTTAPYTFSFTPTVAGTYVIRAVATDNQLLTSEHAINLDVGIANPPVVAITSPAEGAVLIQGASVILAANATDDVSVTRVQFFAGISEPLMLLGEDSTAPYTIEFTPGSAGLFTIQAVATDNLGLTNAASLSVVVEAPDASLRTVSTAFGRGADVQANEHNDTVSGLDSDLNTRTSSEGDRNELVALRFDLEEFDLAQLSDVTLNLINYRNNSARQVALYGVLSGSRGATDIFSTEDWEEFGLADFGDLPGLLNSDGDFTTQSIDESKVIPLGQITFANLTRGTVETFNDPALTDFVRGQTGSKLVMFVLAAAPGYTSTGQARFASKEALALEGDAPGDEPGRFAPFLSFKIGGVQELKLVSLTRAGNELTLQWSGGTGPYSIQRATSVSGPWTDLTAGVAGTSATITIDGAAGFFRVAGR